MSHIHPQSGGNGKSKALVKKESGEVTLSVANFTSQKLDLQKYLMADSRLKPADKLVAICILHHLNAQYGKAFVSEETIGDEVCISRSSVQRAIRRLKKTGWLASRKTITANIYGFSDRNINSMIDRQLVLREARQQKRLAYTDTTAASRVTLPKYHGCVTGDASAASRVTHKHLSRTPYREVRTLDKAQTLTVKGLSLSAFHERLPIEHLFVLHHRGRYVQ
jgi:predicted transcriptional regulator